jgi:hypothetical protein
VEVLPTGPLDRLPRFEYNKCSTGLQRESRVTRFDLAITGGGINGCGIARGPFGLEYLKAAENLLGRARSRVCDKSSRAFSFPDNAQFDLVWLLYFLAF